MRRSQKIKIAVAPDMNFEKKKDRFSLLPFPPTFFAYYSPVLARAHESSLASVS